MKFFGVPTSNKRESEHFYNLNVAQTCECTFVSIGKESFQDDKCADLTTDYCFKKIII